MKTPLSRLALAGVLVAGCGAVLKPPSPDRRLAVQTSGTQFDSDRGYRFAALPEPGANVVRLDVRYPIGSNDDPPGKAGLAHLVEHMLFEVEIQRDGQPTSIGAEISRLALGYNAATYADHTTYITVAPPAALEELMRLEVERLQVGCVGISRETFDRERAVVLAELRQNQGASGAAIERLIKEAIYPAGHPARAVDSVASVAALTYEDMCGFLVTTYRQGPAIVIASGAVDGATLQAAAAKYLGGAPRRSAARAPLATVPARHATARVRADVDDPTLFVTWPLPPRASRDFRMLQLATGYIDGYLGSEAAAYKLGHDASAFVMGSDAAPLLAVTLTLAGADRADDGIAAVERAVSQSIRALTYGVDNAKDPRWMARWQPHVESLVARWESLPGRNTMLGEMLAAGAKGDSLGARVDELVRSQPTAVRELAEAWLDADRANILVIEPTGSPGRLTAETATGQIAGHSHRVHVDGALADQPLALPAGRVPLQAESYVTGNGMRVVLWPHGNAPVVHGRLVIDSGRAHEPAGLEGISMYAGGGAGVDSMIIYARELSTQVDDLVARVTAELRRPGYDVSEDDLARAKQLLQRDANTTSTQYAREVNEALYGAQHPYARAPLTLSSASRITQDSAQAWARSHVVPANATLVIAGRFDPALVKQHIAYRSDQVDRGDDSPAIAISPAIADEPRFVYGEAKAPSPTVTLTASFVAGRGVDRDHASRIVLRAALESVFADLRADAALTYGTSVSYEARQAGGLWTIQSTVDARRAGEAATALLARLAAVRADPEAIRAPLVLARKSVLEALLLDSADSAELADELAGYAIFDLDGVQSLLLAERVAATTLAPFHAFIQRELPASNLVFGAYGNAEPVAAAIAAARAAAAP